MKSKNGAKIIVVLVVLLLSVIYTLPSTPLWENAFGSLTPDEQNGLPIKLFEYKDDPANQAVLLTVSVDQMAQIFNRSKNPARSDEFLDNVSDTIRKKLVEMGYETRVINSDYESNIKKATLRIKIENTEKLKTVIAESKLYAKLPLLIASFFPQKKITLGLDLKGGIDLVYQVDTDSIAENDSITDAVNRSVEIIRNRIDMYGIAEPSIKAQEGNRIRIQLPGVKDPERVKQLIQNTAMLQFHIVLDQAATAAQLEPINPASEIVLMQQSKPGIPATWYKLNKTPDVTGRDLKFAKVAFDEMSSPMVHLEFNAEGAHKFAVCTGNHVGDQLAIVLDNKVYSAPSIQARINGGLAQITGKFSFEEASNLAIVLRAGALPANLIALESRVVGPTLGQQSIEAGFRAGIIGFILVMLFMAVYYKACGVVADIAVMFNSIIVFACLVFFGGTMTMPGIAGFILSVGIAVDANVIIFERIREEFHSGKTVRASIAAGFDRALSCIIDSNVTTLLVVAILYNFASGPIRGFATTLGIGLVANVYTAVIFTKLCLEGWFNSNTKRTLSI